MTIAGKSDPNESAGNHFLCLSAILFLALAVRVLALLSLRNTVYFDFLLWDERLYHDWAVKIANGAFASTSVFEFAPLPAYVMAAIYQVFSPNVLYARIMNVLLGVFVCYWIYCIGTSLGGRKIGLGACLAACLYEPFIFYSIVPLKTTLSIALFAFSACLLLSVLTSNSNLKLFMLGAIMGLMVNVRGNYAVLPIVIAPWIVLNFNRAGLKKAGAVKGLAVFLIGLSLSASPFVVRNWWVSGQMALSTSQMGRNLYYSNNLDNPDPYYRPVSFASSSPSRQAVQFVIEASRRNNTRLSAQEASAYWTREVIGIGLEHPGALVWKMIQKVFALVNRFEPGDHYHVGFLRSHLNFFQFPFLPLWLLLPLGMAGMLTAGRGNYNAYVLALLFLSYSSTLVLFHTTTRYRLPLLVILIPFAVFGVERLLRFVRRNAFGKCSLYVMIVVIFFVVEFLPLRGTGEMAPYYNTHAIALYADGRTEEAKRYWEKSSQMNQAYSAFADIALAELSYKTGNYEGGMWHLNKISDTSFAAALKYEIMGDLMLSRGNPAEAVSFYKKSLEINWGELRTHGKLAKAYGRMNDPRALEQLEVLTYITSFYDE